VQGLWEARRDPQKRQRTDHDERPSLTLYEEDHHDGGNHKGKAT
jgi:hypothetical protein